MYNLRTQFEQGGAVKQAQGLAALGRGEDTQLIHMTPSEIQNLQTLAQKYGGGLTVNPNTGLPEAGFLKNIIPMLVGGALAIGTGGLGLTLAPWMVGGAMGLGGLAASGGDFKQAAKWGLGGLGGASLATSLRCSGSWDSGRARSDKSSNSTSCARSYWKVFAAPAGGWRRNSK
jgi:hypothetical protein